MANSTLPDIASMDVKSQIYWLRENFIQPTGLLQIAVIGITYLIARITYAKIRQHLEKDSEKVKSHARFALSPAQFAIILGYVLWLLHLWFDRDNFLKRLGNVLSETATPCFAWALIPNHAHLFPRTGTTAIATVMRRLLTGYAVSFNCRHRRHGQLFQNRYKTILCQEAFERLIKRVAKLFDISPKELLSGGKHTKTVKARSVVCYWGNRELGMSTIELSKKMKISQPTASQSVVRGQKIAHEGKLAILN